MLKLVLKGDEGTSMETSVTTRPIIIGRGEGSTFLIHDSSISLNHAKITMRQGKVFIRDLDSTNGVLVNGQRISSEKSKHIVLGDEIKIGLNILHLEESTDDADTERTVIINKSHTDAKLKLVLKGDRETSGETSVTSKPIIIGRGEGSTLLLNDTSVSLNHAKISLRQNKVYIKDLDSTNGVFVNGNKIPAAKAVNISPGDEIKIGLNVFYLEEYSEEEGIDKTVITKPKPSLTEKEIRPQADIQHDKVTREQKSIKSNIPADMSESGTLNMDKGKSLLQMPKLVIISGEDTGKEFYINKELLIGRSEDNDIVLKDPLVSRGHHAKVVRHKDDWITITDLNSVNGVLIGKAKIKEAILASGMEIQIGDTFLRFIEPGEVVSLKRKESEEHAIVKFIKTVPRPILVSLSFFFLALMLLFVMSGNEKDSEPQQPAAVNAKKTANVNSINLYLSNSKNFMNRESWNEAISELNNVLSVDPDNYEAELLKNKAETELGYQMIMQEAYDKADKGKFIEAISTLDNIPSTSVYYDRAGVEILKYMELGKNINQE
ncbi:MAG: FHA domain-containing protein [Nitrospiraceae bacterium]|nr:MAG: FHA domain-containing protein [Nitrospiraceae bacterium]